MTVRFIEAAEAELDEAITHYESQSPGLGSTFLLEVLAAVDRISRYPDAWHRITDDIRRCRLARFPYGLIYSEEAEDIVVLAVAHLHRKPGYWRNRARAAGGGPGASGGGRVREAGRWERQS